MLVRLSNDFAGATPTLNRQHQEASQHLLRWCLGIARMRAGYVSLCDTRLIPAWECAVSTCNSWSGRATQLI